ncbi:Crp/Fnr family transcriptional regulator [Planobispora siamensis]|uniref:Crp/Fnr family transcriptional regulator n=1 Tax=Planobispora siamensis TaxID=936338 RepID=A0A8J3SLI6_9ACTN|nr:Crp/Fnr family transcriptional regulator [Planobispora siamensis]GIH96641.1 Crp/Fnr family transcriptional regulator [Planobispora siamensis]
MTTEIDVRGNQVLAAVPPSELNRLAEHLEPVTLKVGDVLYEAGGNVSHVYFPLTAVLSLLTDLGGRQLVEVATVGDEGMAGLSVFLGAGPPTERASVQIAGAALRISAEQFRNDVVVLDGGLQTAIQRYVQAVFTMMARNSACNRAHNIRQRCARWLLMTADRVHSDSFDLTQEFLAQMLGVRRASVSEVATALAADGCIRYSRGTIDVTDHERLRGHACSCYAVIREAFSVAYQGLG